MSEEMSSLHWTPVRHEPQYLVGQDVCQVSVHLFASNLCIFLTLTFSNFDFKTIDIEFVIKQV